MNAAPAWLTLFDVGQSGVGPLLLLKLTAILACAWLVHAVQGRCNPRWRVLLWRSTACAIVLSTALTIVPPLWTVPLLPASTHDTGSADVHSSPDESATAPLALRSLDNSRQRAFVRLEGRGTADPPPSETCATPGGNRDSGNEVPGHSESAVRRLVDSGAWTSFQTVVPLVYTAGVLVHAAWAIIGLRRLRLLLRRTTPVAVPILAQATRAALALGLQNQFTLRQTSDLRVPCVAGCRRPVVLLPERQCQNEYGDELPAILAHELAHVHGRDPFANALLHLLSMALWFHPLMWRVRIAHIDACDGVADALAAEYLQDATGYCRTLARLTLRVTAPGTTSGLITAQAAGVHRRITELRRFVYSAGLPQLHTTVAFIIVLVGALALGGLALATNHPVSAPTNTPAATPHHKSIRV